MQQAVKEMGRKFRETVLALGGGKSPLEVMLVKFALPSISFNLLLVKF